MRATVMYGAGNVRIESVPDARIVEATDALLRVRLGHEFIGVVEDVGAKVRTLRKGDVVVAPFAISDGTCEFCTDHSAGRAPRPYHVGAGGAVGRVFDRTVPLDGVADGYRAMNGCEAIKVMVKP